MAGVTKPAVASEQPHSGSRSGEPSCDKLVENRGFRLFLSSYHHLVHHVISSVISYAIALPPLIVLYLPFTLLVKPHTPAKSRQTDRTTSPPLPLPAESTPLFAPSSFPKQKIWISKLSRSTLSTLRNRMVSFQKFQFGPPDRCCLSFGLSVPF